MRWKLQTAGGLIGIDNGALSVCLFVCFLSQVIDVVDDEQINGHLTFYVWNSGAKAFIKTRSIEDSRETYGSCARDRITLMSLPATINHALPVITKAASKRRKVEAALVEEDAWEDRVDAGEGESKEGREEVEQMEVPKEVSFGWEAPAAAAGADFVRVGSDASAASQAASPAVAAPQDGLAQDPGARGGAAGEQQGGGPGVGRGEDDETFGSIFVEMSRETMSSRGGVDAELSVQTTVAHVEQEGSTRTIGAKGELSFESLGTTVGGANNEKSFESLDGVDEDGGGLKDREFESEK